MLKTLFSKILGWLAPVPSTPEKKFDAAEFVKSVAAAITSGGISYAVLVALSYAPALAVLIPSPTVGSVFVLIGYVASTALSLWRNQEPAPAPAPAPAPPKPAGSISKAA